MGNLHISDRLLVRVGAVMLLDSILVGQVTSLIGVVVPPVVLFLVGLVGFLMLGWALLHKSFARQKLVNDHMRKTGGDSRISQQDRFSALSDSDRMHDRLP
jgi:xanthosine utilization system XapX-like protein